jgi:hypothetical protein
LIFEFGFEFDFFTLKIELINPAPKGRALPQIAISYLRPFGGEIKSEDFYHLA